MPMRYPAMLACLFLLAASSVAGRDRPDRSAERPGIEAGDIRITVVRAGCFWQCPEYAISVRGDGWIAYRGSRHVVVDGLRTWRLPADALAPLLALSADPALWTMAKEYRADVFDGETVLLRLRTHGRDAQVLIYPLNDPDAPVAAQRLVEAVDRLPDVDRWVRLSGATIEALQAEGFDFRSPDGGELLKRALTVRGPVHEASVLRLLELGAPADVRLSPGGVGLVERALHQGLFGLVQPLIDAGALDTDGRPDQDRIDASFRAAIASGRMDAVQRIWRIQGTRPHPALHFTEDENIAGGDPPRTLPVVLLLDPSSSDEAWEGEQIARWLHAQGNDLTARTSQGHGLMHAAANAATPGLMQFLLAQGVDPAGVPHRNLLHFSTRQGEGMALALLDALEAGQPDLRLPPDYRAVAELQEWKRVLAWLEARPHRLDAGCRPAATAGDCGD